MFWDVSLTSGKCCEASGRGRWSVKTIEALNWSVKLKKGEKSSIRTWDVGWGGMSGCQDPLQCYKPHKYGGFCRFWVLQNPLQGDTEGVTTGKAEGWMLKPKLCRTSLTPRSQRSPRKGKRMAFGAIFCFHYLGELFHHQQPSFP